MRLSLRRRRLTRSYATACAWLREDTAMGRVGFIRVYKHLPRGGIDTYVFEVVRLVG